MHDHLHNPHTQAHWRYLEKECELCAVTKREANEQKAMLRLQLNSAYERIAQLEAELQELQYTEIARHAAKKADKKPKRSRSPGEDAFASLRKELREIQDQRGRRDSRGTGPVSHTQRGGA